MAESRTSAAPPLNPSWLASQGRLPLAFMALGLAWLGLATGLLVADPDLLAFAHSAPPLVGLVHAWVLGVFVTVATGAIYQLAPVALGTTLWSERLGWWHFGLQALSIPGMVYAFWRWDLALLGHFGSGFTAGIVLFTLNTWRTVRGSGRRDPVAWSLVLAAVWLLLTALFGLLVAANRFWFFIPTHPLTLLRAHAHLGLVGFFLTLLQGVTFRLVPMFTLGEVPDWRPVRLGLWLSQVGLVGLVPALACDSGHLASLFGTAVLVGLLCSAWALRRTLATRKKRTLDPGLHAFAAGMALLPVAGGAGVLLATPLCPWGSAPGGLSANVYGILVFVGGLLPTVAGMLCKIVPFLTWMRAYGPKVGRVPTPAAGALVRPGLQVWSFRFQGAALVGLLIGSWTGGPLALRAGAWLLAIGVGLFLADMIGVLKHLVAPARASIRAPSPQPT